MPERHIHRNTNREREGEKIKYTMKSVAAAINSRGKNRRKPTQLWNEELKTCVCCVHSLHHHEYGVQALLDSMLYTHTTQD